MTKPTAAANAAGLPALDPDYVDLAAIHLATLFDMIVSELCDVVRGGLDASDAAALDRADALAWIGRDFTRELSARMLEGLKSPARSS